MKALALGGVAALSLMGLALQASSASAADGDKWVLQKTEASIAEAKAAGLKDAGEKVEVPKGKKIGLILLSMQSPANYRIATTLQNLGKKFGYEVIVCDPDFDPQRVTQCATSIVAQKPDAVLSDAHEPVVLGSALRDAHEMGIPWFALVVNVSKSPYLMQYGITGHEVGQVYDTWLLDEIAKRKGEGKPHKVMAIGAPALGAALLAQQEQLAADIKARPGAELVVQHDLDLPNAVQDTLNITKQTLGQHPDIGGTWTVCDFCVPLMAQVYDSEGLTGADRPVVGGNYLAPQTADLMRKGRIDGVVDISFESSVHVIFDQLLQKWSRDKAINDSADVFSTAYSLKFMVPYMVTKENIGPEGQLPIFGANYEDYFASKWNAEFGVQP
jgi:ABC-type sugar transport system substrate-binding protein